MLRVRSLLSLGDRPDLTGDFALLSMLMWETVDSSATSKFDSLPQLSGFELGKQGLDDFAQRQFRIRQITIEPGGVAAFHSHKERPALTYIMKGGLTENRKGGPARTYKAGEVLTETTDIDHWAENITAEPVIVISAAGLGPPGNRR
jgi:quercetin dioxygenase-like cupin family protein